MHGSVPFGQPGHVAAGYAHKALDTANSIGTGMMMWLMQLLMQMLLELLERHHQQKKIKGYEEAVERIRYLESWSKQRYQELEADQDGGDMVEFGQKLGDNLLDSMAPVPQPSPEKQREIAERLKAKHEEQNPEKKHAPGKKWGNNDLGM